MVLANKSSPTSMGPLVPIVPTIEFHHGSTAALTSSDWSGHRHSHSGCPGVRRACRVAVDVGKILISQ